MSRTPIRTCCVGVGLGGLTFHCSFIIALPELFTLHSVLERNPQNGGKLQQRYGVAVKIHNNIEQVLADDEIELVVVTTPNQTHFSIAKACLEAGKHVLIDKPVTTTSTEAKELGAIAISKGLTVYGFQNRRYDSDFLALRKLLELPSSSPDYIGKLVEFESHYDRYRPQATGSWKDNGGGQLYDLGSHLIDQALALFGRPHKLTAFLQNIRKIGNPEQDDCFTVYFHYQPSSARPHLFTAILRAHILSVTEKQVRFIVRGTRGTFRKVGLDIQEPQLKAMAHPSEIFTMANYGKEPKEIWGTLEVGDNLDSLSETRWPSTDPGCYHELYKNLAAVIRDGAEPAIKWEEAIAVIEMIELAHKSSKEGKTVQVPE
ncbi:NAD(P)-binding protein [Mycena floridula]|nr:NAD(P)-binding protein [Mycena floridula]